MSPRVVSGFTLRRAAQLTGVAYDKLVTLGRAGELGPASRRPGNAPSLTFRQLRLLQDLASELRDAGSLVEALHDIAPPPERAPCAVVVLVPRGGAQARSVP